MTRIVVSGTYTVTSFLAALSVVVLVVRTADVQEQAKFFYFQAIFYVLNTVISQSLTLLTFRNNSTLLPGLVADACALIAVFGFLHLSPGLEYTMVDQVCFSLATVLLYRGAAYLISVQFFSANSWRYLWVPVTALVARIVTAWAFSDFGPAQIFLANGVACFLVPTVVIFTGILKRPDSAKKRSEAKGPTTLSIFFFFFVGALTFQWERILYGLNENIESLVATGYVMTVVLPPLSFLFATLYRGSAREIFTAQDVAMQRKRFVRIGGTFGAGAVAYLCFLVVFWPFVMQLLGAQTLPDSRLVILLGAAIILDRLANLLVFLDQGNAIYVTAALAKSVAILTGCALAAYFGFATPLANYIIFAMITLSYLCAVLLRRA